MKKQFLCNLLWRTYGNKNSRMLQRWSMNGEAVIPDVGRMECIKKDC
ncbi:hypothetical protein [Brevibacillus fortis]